MSNRFEGSAEASREFGPERSFSGVLVAGDGLDEKEFAMELRKKLTMQQILIDDVTNVR